jgi:hypothetical protein
MKHKVNTLKGASSISQDGAGKRLVSEDGLRWAISRNQKRQLGDHRFDVVECWTLKQRVHGKAVIFAIQQSEEAAREFVFGK